MRYFRFKNCRFNSITNKFLWELKEMLELGRICTISINNKSEFMKLMKYLGFSFSNDDPEKPYFFQSNGWDMYSIYINFNKCFDVDGGLSKLTEKTCTPDMLWRTEYDTND